jgi:hypothetical protein
LKTLPTGIGQGGFTWRPHLAILAACPVWPGVIDEKENT